MTADLDGLVRLTKAQVKPAAEVMARAFENYPLNAIFHPDGQANRKKQVRRYEPLVRYCLFYGEVYATSPKLEGVAMWLPPDRIERTFWRNIRSGGLGFLAGMLRRKQPRQRIFHEYSNATHQRCAPFPHVYLQMLGVDPAHQGKGYSSLLLRAMFSRIDREGLPCFLLTHDKKNVGIYEHLGFRVVEQGIIPGSDVISWAMLREVPGE